MRRCCCGSTECSSFLCKSLDTLVSGCSGISTEAANHEFTKITYTLSGYRDWSYDGSYANYFRNFDTINVLKPIVSGDANVNLKIDILGLDILNRDYIFNKKEISSSESIGSCIFSKDEDEYLGDITYKATITLSALNATMYLRNMFKAFYICNPITYSLCSIPLTAATRFFYSSLNSEWLGDISIICKFAVYSKSQSFAPNCKYGLKTPLDFAFILKDTSIETSGVYNNYGYSLKNFNIQCDCDPLVCNNVVGSPCSITNCSYIINKEYYTCRSLFPSNGPNFSDTTITYTNNGTCKNSCVTVYNVKNFSPLGSNIIKKLGLIMMPIPVDCDDKHYSIDVSISPISSDNLCLYWNDASDKIEKEYTCSTTEYIETALSNSVYSLDRFNDTSYLDKIFTCSNGDCGENSSNTGIYHPEDIGILTFPHESINEILKYVLGSYRSSFSCGNYTEDKIMPTTFNSGGAVIKTFDNMIIAIPPPSYDEVDFWIDAQQEYNYISGPWIQWGECNDFTYYNIVTPNNGSFAELLNGSLLVTQISVKNNPNKLYPAFILSTPINPAIEVLYE